MIAPQKNGFLQQLSQSIQGAGKQFQRNQQEDLYSKLMGVNPEFAQTWLAGQQSIAKNNLEEDVIQRQQQADQQRKTALQGLFSGQSQNPMDLYAQAARVAPEEFGGGYLKALADSQKDSTPAKIREFKDFMAMSPAEQVEFTRLYGPSSTNVSVNTAEGSPYQNEFLSELAQKRGASVVDLEKESQDYLSQVSGSEQALSILMNNPNMEIGPLTPISNNIKSLFSSYLTEDQLKNVSDYQTLESQLIRNRFDVTKVLKGAITEQEQAAAQRVAGSATGTRQGLFQTLINNIAFGTLQAHERETRSQYIRAMGEDYSPAEFNKYYKELGETGQRPTLDTLLNDLEAQFAQEVQVVDPIAAELKRRRALKK